jgi:hypothetical protein
MGTVGKIIGLEHLERTVHAGHGELYPVFEVSVRRNENEAAHRNSLAPVTTPEPASAALAGSFER